MNKPIRRFLMALAVLALIGGAFAAGVIVSPMIRQTIERDAAARPKLSPSSSAEADSAPFWEAWNLIQHQYYGKLADQQALLHGAIGGLVDALDDPYSLYLSGDDIANGESNGDLQSLGLAVEKRDGRLVVVAPLAGSPAQRAGIRSGDHIVRIGTRDTASLTLSEAVSLLRGPAGSTVTLTIVRDNSPIGTVDISHDASLPPLVTGKLLADSIAYVNIAVMSGSAARDLTTLLQQFADRTLRGIVLDLRNNPGGYVDAAVEVAGQFITDGTVVTQQTRDGTISWAYSDHGKLLIIDGPDGKKTVPVRNNPVAGDARLVVLVNRGTASAAEVLAAALHDHHRAILVGEPTYGKAAVSGDYVLSDGSSLHITNGQWLSPSGRSVAGQGLAPDIVVPDVSGENDNVLARAVAFLLTGQ